MADSENVLVEDWLATQDAFDRFAAVSGDDNPIHVDAAFSARTRFGATVAHGMLLYSRVWAMLRRHYPRLRQESQTLMFPNPTFAGDEVRFEAHIKAGEGGSLTAEVSAFRRSDSEPVLLGRTVLVPEGA